MRNGILAAGVLLATTFAVASPAAATVTFEEARFTGEANAYARHDPNTGTLVANTLPAAPLVQDRYAFASAHGSEAQVKGSASFTDATSGAVDYEQVYAGSRWLKELPSGADAYLQLSYTFTVDRSYLLGFSYDVELDDKTDFDFYLYKGGALVTFADFTGQGYLLSDAFGPGTYTLSIRADSRAQSSPDLDKEYNTASGKVGFTLLVDRSAPTSPTPEPATWALMIAGFGMAGVGLRRRRVLV